MEKVLLAVDGIDHDRIVFNYAIELCKRIKAELNVFQIIRPKNYSKYIKKIRQQADLARTYIEGSMVAATFAEAGEHETAIDIMAEASEIPAGRLIWRNRVSVWGLPPPNWRGAGAAERARLEIV